MVSLIVLMHSDLAVIPSATHRFGKKQTPIEGGELVQNYSILPSG